MSIFNFERFPIQVIKKLSDFFLHDPKVRNELNRAGQKSADFGWENHPKSDLVDFEAQGIVLQHCGASQLIKIPRRNQNWFLTSNFSWETRIH